MSAVQIKRVPIKIRHPIKRDFCSCYKAKVMHIDGLPGLLVYEGMDVKNYLDSVNTTVPILTEDVGIVDDCIGYGVPVGVRTSVALDEKLVLKLGELQHCAIQTSIGILGDNLSGFVGELDFVVSPIREMMHLAKSKKIFLSLNVPYYPHLSDRLDLYDRVDSYKNLVDNVSIHYPDISDDVVQEYRGIWGPLVMEKFKALYVPNVPTRSWQLKPKYRSDITYGIVTFLKSKRIPVEIVQDIVTDSRIKRISSGYSNFPLGMRTALYVKEDGKFHISSDYSEQPCIRCGRNLFL